MKTDSERREPEDEVFLGELLGELVRAVEDGRPTEIAAAIAARPHLRADIESTAELASNIAVRRPPSAPLLPGFVSFTEIGRGAMGTVYAAVQERLGRRVAVKLLPSRWTASQRARDRFLREARSAARLQHPHVVPVYDFGEHERTPYLVMELVDGRSLAGVLTALRSMSISPESITEKEVCIAAGLSLDSREQPRTWPQIASKWILQIARALDAAHRAGVVHRDVKPSNILIRKDGSALLGDFGLALHDDDESITHSGEILGTPQYAAPEQLKRGIDTDGRADVYALGATLFECLTLRRPFDGASTQEIVRQVLEEEPPSARRFAAALPKDLETLCAHALEKSPGRRYATAAAMAEDLERFLAGRPIAARPVRPWERGARWAARHPARAATGILAFLLLAVVPSALLWLSDRHAQELERQIEITRREATKYRQTLDYIDAWITQGAHEVARHDLTAAELLESSSLALLVRRPEDPEVEGVMRLMVGGALVGLSQGKASEPHLRRAISLLEATRGAKSAETLRAMSYLGDSLRMQRKADRELLELRAKVVAIHREQFGAEHPQTVRAELKQVQDLIDVEPAEKLEPMAREIVRKLEQDSQPTAAVDRLRAKSLLGTTLFAAKKYSEAEAVLSETALEQARTFGEARVDTIATQSTLAITWFKLGKLAEAETALLEAHRLSLESLPPGQHYRMTTALLLGQMLAQGKKHAQAQEVLRAGLREVRASQGGLANECYFLEEIANLPNTVVENEQRVADLEAAAHAADGIHGARSARALRIWYKWGAEALRIGRPADAIPALEHAADTLREDASVDADLAVAALAKLAEAKAALGLKEEALALAEESAMGLRAHSNITASTASGVAALLVKLFEKCGEPEKAQDLLQLAKAKK